MSRRKKESEKSKIGKFFSSVAKTGKSFGKSVLEATGPCVVCGKRTTTFDYWEYIVLKNMNVDLKHMQGTKDDFWNELMPTRLYVHNNCYTSFFDKYVQESKVMKKQLNEECYELREKHREISSELELQLYDDSSQDNLSLIIASEEIMNFKDWEDNLVLLSDIESKIKRKGKIIKTIHSWLKTRGVPNVGASGSGHYAFSTVLNDAFHSGNFLAYAEMFHSSKSDLKLTHTKVSEYEYPKGSEVLKDLLQQTAMQIEKVKTLATEEVLDFIDRNNLAGHRKRLMNFAMSEISSMETEINKLTKTFHSKFEKGEKDKQKKESEKKAKAKKEAAEKKAKAKKEAAELKEVKLKQKAGMMKAGVPERIFSLWVEDILTKSQMLKMLQIFGESISDWELELEYICETEVNRFSHIDHGRVMFCPEYVREIETIDERITFLHDLISEFPKAMVRYSFENPTNQEQLEFLKRISTNDDFYYLYLAIINDGFEIDFSAKLVNDYGFDKHLDALQEVIDGANWEGVAAKHGFLQL